MKKKITTIFQESSVEFYRENSPRKFSRILQVKFLRIIQENSLEFYKKIS